MLRNDLINKSPAITIMGRDALQESRLGAVLSRAGVGKTKFLVQIALSHLLEGGKVLHISLDDPMDKINLRYKDGYNSLIESIGYVDPQKALRLWEDIAAFKTGFSYLEASFAPEKIGEYLKSLKKENLHMPVAMVVDGLDFDTDQTQVLDNLQQLSTDFDISIWFSMRSHREEPLCSGGFPKQLDAVKERFDKAIFLQPEEDKIEAVILKDGNRAGEQYLLNPATMMIN